MKKLRLFSGPCVLESRHLALQVARELKKSMPGEVDLTFKGSFDKANRSSLDSFRGPGLEEGLNILSEVKEQTALPVLTDFHLPEQAQAVAEIVDVLQIPAFLCRQTDMIVAGAKACARYGRTLKIKKAQFLSAPDMENVVEKARSFLPKEQILLTERGSCFGYNNLIVDMASFAVMKEFGVQVIYDATHSVQRPGGLGKQTGGKREQIPGLAKAALAAGADGLFMETHPEPQKALSDAATCYPLDGAAALVRELLPYFHLAQGQQG